MMNTSRGKEGRPTWRNWEWTFSPLTTGSPILSDSAWGMGSRRSRREPEILEGRMNYSPLGEREREKRRRIRRITEKKLQKAVDKPFSVVSHAMMTPVFRN